MRDFHSFNIVLLVKQCCRLLQNLTSLVANVFKAKYFWGGIFMEAKQGHNSSLVWRSLLVGKELLSKGVIWRIGNGQQVNI